MTRVLVAVKRVPDVSGDVQLTPDQQGLDGRYVGYTIGTHDSCAVELGIRVAERDGGSVTVLSVGAADAVEQLRTALALGAHAGVLVETDPAGLGPADVAAEIAAVVGSATQAGEPFDMVLLGNDAADTGDFQVPTRLAYALGVPIVTGATSLGVTGEQLTAKVRGPYGEESYAVPLPAVVAVLEGGAEPRYPTLRGRMAAKKVPIDVRPPARDAAGTGRVGWHLPPAPPSSTEVLGEGPESAPAVVEVLRRTGVLA